MPADFRAVSQFTSEVVNVADGVSLFCRVWEPSGIFVATLIIVHGLGEHSGRYVHVGKFFAESGFRTIAFDQRGHGRSAGQPVFMKEYSVLGDDVGDIVKCFASGPTFLFGHSFGGQVVLWSAQHLELGINGLIVSAPWLALAHSPPGWQVAMGRWLHAICPGFRFPTGIHPGNLSHDRAHLDSLEDLDLVHPFVTVRAYREAVKAAAEILNQTRIDHPLFLAHGDADPVTSREVAEEYFNRLRAPSKTLKIYPGFLHELHNETARAEVLNDYLTWMKSIIQTGFLEREGAQNRN
ncbi:MAG TPA: alpha/beta hydrolase [Chthoniobacterales bacterium]|nr:alpha/beta hydrolase [Chthoniobacterales bacterium]